MGLGLYLSLEREIAGVDPLGIDGKSLARAQFVLDRIAREQQIRPLKSLLCVDRKEAMDFLEDVGLDPDEIRLPEEEWFAASDGRATVARLLSHLRQSPDSVPNADRVIADLEAIEKVLAAAEEQQVRFHFSLDLPL
jgi:hypothetical protein